MRRAWRVRVDEPFARYIAEASTVRTHCLRNVISQLRLGEIDLIASGLLPGLYFIWACDVTISAAVHDDTVVLTAVAEEADE